MARSAGLAMDVGATHRVTWPGWPVLTAGFGALHPFSAWKTPTTLYRDFPQATHKLVQPEFFLSSVPLQQGRVAKHPRQFETACLSFVVNYRPVIILLPW